MISLQLTSPWSVCTPQVHRYLLTRYVEEFFADGSLRLSSVELFRKHVDERRDPNEGIANFFHRTPEGGGQTIVARAEQGDNAYILCGGTYFSVDLMARFDCDSFIRIDDTVAFGQAVSRHVPGFTGGAEGLCRYQSARAFERDLGFVDGINVTLPDGTQAYDQARLLQVLGSGIGVVPLFLKEIRFSCEAEYRFIWFSASSVAPYLIVKVPEAREYCSRPGDIVVELGDAATGT